MCAHEAAPIGGGEAVGWCYGSGVGLVAGGVARERPETTGGVAAPKGAMGVRIWARKGPARGLKLGFLADIRAVGANFRPNLSPG